MDFKYYILSRRSHQVSYAILSREDDEIGLVEGWLNDEGGLTSVVMVNSEYQGMKIGYKSFIKVFEELNENIRIKYFKASWNSGDEYSDFEDGMSTNLRIFQNCKKNNDCNFCVFKTPTGKWMKKIGFNNFKINLITNEQVEVIFYT